MNGRPWTQRELRALREIYPRLPAEQLAKRLGRSKPSIVWQAHRLGLRKSGDYLNAHPRSRRGGPRHRHPGTTSEYTQRRKYLAALKELRQRRQNGQRQDAVLPWDPSAESFASWLIRFRESQRPAN